jgi:flagellar motor protein MotB
MPERVRSENELSDLGLTKNAAVKIDRNIAPPDGFDYEFSKVEIGKYREFIKRSSESGKSANDITNLIFVQLNPEFKGKKLKETDRERLKNQWSNIYYEIVLPLLGRTDKQTKFDYPQELQTRIEQAVKQFDNAYEVLLGIKLKFPSVAEYDNHPEVLKSRTNANKTLFESLIPMVIEGLNLNKPDEIYKAVMALDDGRLIDTYVDIMARNPALLSEESRKRYESVKLLISKTIKNTIKIYLETRKPSDVQTGVEPKRAKGENVKAKPKPDNAKYNLTGRFEYVNRSDAQQPFGMVLCLNQAGNWIEGVLSIVGNPQKFADNPKFFYRFYTEIKDWSKPNPMIYIRGNLHAFKVNARLVIQNAEAVQLVLDEGPLNFKKVSGNPILTERHLAYFKDNPLVRQTQWFPLLSPQRANLKSYFKDFTSYRPIQKFPKYNNLIANNRRLLNVKNLIVKAVNGDTDSLDLLASSLNQFIDENIHKSDRDIAAFYIRNYLDDNYYDKDGWKLTFLSWLYRQLRINKKYNYSNFVKFIYGDKSGDRITTADKRLYQYEIDVKVKGFGIGFFIKAGYYRGDITIRCKQWEEFGVKNADGSKEAKLRIQFGELGGGFVESLNFGQSFSGVAESDVLWMPADFVGMISIMKADAEVGANITKIRKKLGISAGIGATMGLMEIIGDSNLPPLNFGVYSLSGVVGGVEPEPHPQRERESKVGVEVTGSVAIGSIWKDGALPVPRDVIKYGNEETVLKTAYQGDGRAHFKHDSALLTSGAENLIRKLCANEMYLLLSPKTVITITGHTDMSGTDKYNEGLSKNRANNVKQKIIDVCGTKIKADIKEPLYKGEELAKKDPLKKYRDPRFRRVDITINGQLVLSLVGE